MTAADFTLRASGSSRFFGVAFLGVWLCGWAIGEAVVLAVLGLPVERLVPLLARLPMPRGVAGPPRLFLIAWALFWTFGGLGALFAFLRLLGGSDRITLGEGALTARRTAFGIGPGVSVPRGAIDSVELRRKDGELVVRSGGRDIALTSFGTREERLALLDAIRARYGVRAATEVPPPGGEPVLPPRWEASLAPDGAWVLRLSGRTRGRTSGCLGVVALALAGAVAWNLRAGRTHAVSAAIFGLLALVSLVFAAGREEIAVWPNRIDQRRWLGPWRRTRTFVGAWLRVSFSPTGEEEWGLLEVVTPEGATKLWSSVDDRATPILLGRWLAARAGWRFEEPAA